MRFRTLLAGSAMLAALAGCATGQMDGQPGEGMTADDEVTTYQGTLPCRNCAGIDLNVQLKGTEQSPAEERTFDLTAKYREHPQNPPAENYAGQWEVLNGTATDPQATVYELTPDHEGQIYYFMKLNQNTLELIDPQRRRFQNGEMLQLKRQ